MIRRDKHPINTRCSHQGRGRVRTGADSVTESVTDRKPRGGGADLQPSNTTRLTLRALGEGLEGGCEEHNGSYPLHGTRNRTRTGNGMGTIENNGSLSLSLSLFSV